MSKSKPAIAKHTCNGGRPPAFGRLAAPGECPRCDELHAGAAPRRPAWAALRRENDAARHAREVRAHTCSPSCGLVCTFGQW